MTEDRLMVIESVLAGDIGVEHVTLEEMQEVLGLLFEAIADKTTCFDTHCTIQ